MPDNLEPSTKNAINYKPITVSSECVEENFTTQLYPFKVYIGTHYSAFLRLMKAKDELYAQPMLHFLKYNDALPNLNSSDHLKYNISAHGT